ncbi:MAG: isoamylase early set domain-containing protein [Deltaproteobacteria bacterium]|nr:isoamylase early set domain-containing protein [Deltaproteobacteria bacterium]
MKELTVSRATKTVRKTPARPTPEVAGIKKEYSGPGSACRVTFRLPKEAAGKAGNVTVVGDFNGWNTDATPLKRQKNGDFSATLELEGNREYRFRYLIDGARWENDWFADRYAPNCYGCDDSVVVL